MVEVVANEREGAAVLVIGFDRGEAQLPHAAKLIDLSDQNLVIVRLAQGNGFVLLGVDGFARGAWRSLASLTWHDFDAWAVNRGDRRLGGRKRRQIGKRR